MRRLLPLLLCLLAAPAALSAQDDLLAKRSKGKATAPVTVYEMSDFQCPYCRGFATEVFPDILKEYVNTGKVRWIFINFPLSSIHPNAAAAAEYAMCAAMQNQFWPVHDALYMDQQTWGPIKDPVAYFNQMTNTLRLDKPGMTACLQSGAGEKLVMSDAAGAKRSGASSTPSFFIEGGMMSGVHPIATWRQVLDSVIKVKAKK